MLLGAFYFVLSVALVAACSYRLARANPGVRIPHFDWPPNCPPGSKIGFVISFLPLYLGLSRLVPHQVVGHIAVVALGAGVLVLIGIYLPVELHNRRLPVTAQPE
jgi:hypothetical protein